MSVYKKNNNYLDCCEKLMQFCDLKQGRFSCIFEGQKFKNESKQKNQACH